MIGNRVTEKDLRDWLTGQGYAGKLAKVNELELHAIQPPGWLQVFRFSVDVRTAKSDSSGQTRPWTTFWGIIVDDERKRGSEKTVIQMFSKQQDQLRSLSDLPEELIQTKSRAVTNVGDYKYSLAMLVVLIGMMLGLALLVDFLS